jgi:hypothetical protein
LYAVDINNAALTATAGGSADALTATYSPAPAALVAGLTLYLRAAQANATTTPQFSPNGLTGKVIVKNNNQALAVGDIAGAGHWLQLVYDATNGVWELMNPATVVGAVQTGGTANGVAYLNGSKVLTTGSAFVFDGTNLGVGTSSPSTEGTNVRLAVVGTAGQQASSLATSNSNAGFTVRGNSSSGYQVAIGATNNSSIPYIQAVNYNGGAASTDLAIQAYGGNVGIGTTSPTALLTAGSLSDGTPATYGGTVKVASATQTSINSVGGIELNVATGYSTKIQQISSGGANLTFCGRQSSATWSEYMRIDSSGRLLVNSTSDVGANNPVFSANAGASAFSNIIEARWTGTGSIYHLLIRNGNGLIGGVTSSGSTTSFLTSSDYRLKDNITPMIGALAKVSALKPVTYKWKIDDAEGEGFIAHELAEVCPIAVHGEKDALNEDGSIKSQSIDTSFLVATLTAAIQEQQALITALTARITALEAK